MALEMKKQNVETESVVSDQKTQVNVRAEAMISGAGRDAVEVLMEDASVRIVDAAVQSGRLNVDALVVCQAAYRQGDADVIRAVEARAQLQHSFEDENVGIGMNACAEACVTHVETGYLNGRIIFGVTVELSGVVTKLASMEVITDIGGVTGVECEHLSLPSARYGAEAVAQASLTETLSLPKELGTQATLMDFATATIDKAERDLGGVNVEGHVNAEVMLTGSISGKPVAMVKYPIPFKQLVQMPEWLTENVHVFAAVDSIRSTLVESGDEMGLKLDADITLRVRAVQQQNIGCVGDAYAVGETDVEAETQQVRMISDIRCTMCEDTVRATVLVPEGMPAIGSILSAHGRVSLTETGEAVSGVIEVAVMYMPAGGEKPVTVRDEIPFRSTVCKASGHVAAEILACEGSALMTDRIDLRCQLRLQSVERREVQADIACAVREMPAQMKKSGLVMYWPAENETAWSIGRRFRIPVNEVAREAGAETIAVGKALILKI